MNDGYKRDWVHSKERCGPKESHSCFQSTFRMNRFPLQTCPSAILRNQPTGGLAGHPLSHYPSHEPLPSQPPVLWSLLSPPSPLLFFSVLWPFIPSTTRYNTVSSFRFFFQFSESSKIPRLEIRPIQKSIQLAEITQLTRLQKQKLIARTRSYQHSI